MNDVIRKAVELADGWKMVSDCAHPPWVSIPNGPAFSLHNPSQILLDALAAQLVRQVDALNGNWVTSSDEVVQVIGPIEGPGGPSGVWHESEGVDRTLNTLRAIVESKVLEQ